MTAQDRRTDGNDKNDAPDAPAPGAPNLLRDPDARGGAGGEKVPVPLKVFGVLCVAAGAVLTAVLAMLLVGLGLGVHEGAFEGEVTSASLTIFIIETMLTTALTAMLFVFGVRLLRNKRRHAAQITEAMIVVLIGDAICDIMLAGLSASLIPYGIELVFLVVMQGYLDPSLAQERELQRRLRDMETREAVEDGTLGRDETGRGYIALNFFNLFWIFVVCCVLGLAIETVYHFVVVDPGHYEDRAGMLFGPFSPIYGFGGVLMTIALNRFHKAHILVVFLVSAVIGGAFEFAVSWFMQFAFGIVAWDYSGTFLSIDGRTNGFFMCMWGLLGVVWVKLLLPWMLRLVNLIPWKWRYSITTVCAALMIANGAMTLISLDCWYQRMAGNSSDSAVGQFFDEHFDNAYMEQRFQSMSIDPDNAARAR